MSTVQVERTDADVVVVGYGPVGRLLALLLGRAGRSVVVVERQPAAYPLPRAVHFDDEVGRILQSVGLPPTALTDCVGAYDDLYEWRAADHEPLLRLDWRGLGPSGWHVSHFFHQPGVERALDAQVEGLEPVQVLRGWRAVSHVQDDEGVTVRLESADGGAREVRAAYLVGADGANSVVRSWIGSQVTDLGYFREWLVVDLVLDADADTSLFTPPAWQLCDPERPTTLVPGGPGRRRFEFMRRPGEDLDELAQEATAWRLLEPWGVGPEQAVLERHAVYTFQARWCDTWRAGRLLLAGDSAHLMPPFAGQGMCSGLRDAVALAWRLDLVLGGLADDQVLDSYGPERSEHVRHFIEGSMALGEVICLSDADAAAARDVAMRADLAAGVEQPPRPLPRLGRGLSRADAGGGLLSLQAEVVGIGADGAEVSGLLDDVVGAGGLLLLGDPALRSALAPADTALLDSLGWRVVALGDEPGEGVVVDSTGTYRDWFAGLGAVAVLVRPDLYVLGSATDAADLTALLEHLRSALRAPAVSAR
ncbi:bifunctional 3-(3-hydroxy-phenyl)propionate/3-hydroxycinnamic acid hydroxylase [Nocardioides sp. GY 10127]|uniref:bifunctional 3-(3-hydroxy-phenyl)propionate/3-hydroxycinnamic acid hydroxylase MhpA n=1 Tax=Nocardioides sp. GY 10127 TaxID=2569762 RepID=UPI00197F4F9F|nr:bifunctional 3-(3-hydroxy-phenyl)propionate/3-hydroxycinnamic acid hydroxylase [Nocardioides sp. GY 10127]